MANSVDPGQTAAIGEVGSATTLFASILKFVSNVRQLVAADDFSRRHFSDAFFLGALRVRFWRIHKRSYFIAPVLLNLLHNLRKRDKMRGLPSI